MLPFQPHRTSILNRCPRAGLLAAAALLVAHSAAAVETVRTYSDSTFCETREGPWTCTSSCTVTTTVGNPASIAGLIAVQFSPATAGPPQVTFTDQFGQPIVVDGVPVHFVPSTLAAQLAESRHGLLSTSHIWSGFTTSVLVSPPVGTIIEKITFTWPVPVLATGATWTSDDGATRNGDTVIDGFTIVGCDADFNQNGNATVQDIFDFLAAYFTANPRADINRSGAVSVQDIFDYLMAYFAGCP